MDDNYAEAIRRIEQAEREGATDLDLSNLYLDETPPSITRLVNLKKLELYNNRLTTVPETITSLTGLTNLGLGENKLTTVSDSIRRLTNLKELRLFGNQFSEFPEAVTHLKGLTELHLIGNPLTKITVKIEQLTNLLELSLGSEQMTKFPNEILLLTNLQDLSLVDFEFTHFPDEFTRLSNLCSLNLVGHHLSTVPGAITQLTNLQILWIWQSQLTEIPDEIKQLTKLYQLVLSKNQLIRVPETLTLLEKLAILDLSHNLLTELPANICLMKCLDSISLRGNRIEVLPEELLDDGKGDYKSNAQPILHYYSTWLASPKRRLNEAKVLLVGEGKAGKSSIIDRLIEDTFDKDKPQTDGILIRQWRVPNGNKDDEGDLRLNVWDFGGQEIQHSTHQFFLSRRSVYVLVVDSRAGEHQSRLDYWLRIVGNYGGDSPVIVVLNKADEHTLKIDEHLYQSKYPNIAGFVRTSCATRQGIAELRAKIIEVAGGLRHVRMDWLQTWFDVRAALENSGKDYLRVEQYEDICKAHGITYASEQQQLLRYLHDLGVQLHFEDVALIGTNILQPDWVTRGVYSIVTDKDVSTSNGALRKADLARILDPKRYPHDTPMFIINVMRQFELCVPMGDEQWLIPDLLSPSQPGDLAWDEADSLSFQYRYEVLPGSVMSRFIANTWPMVNNGIAWRNGISLNYQSGLNTALVKADPEAGIIMISVRGNGPTRRDFLNVIRGHFEHIHRSLKRDVAEYVPIPGHPTVSPELYSDLLAYEEAGEETYFNPKLKKRLSVRELLDGVSGISREQRNALLLILTSKFNSNELETLFYKLEGKSIEFVGGKDKPISNRAIDLIDYFERRRRLHELIDAANRERPK